MDLSHHLRNGMPVYPDDPLPSFENYATLEKEGVNLTRLTMGSHTGTHLDAPRHFIQDGIGIDMIPIDKMIGEAYVAGLSRKPIGSGITSEDLLLELEGKVGQDDMVVCYTGCSEHWGDNSVSRNYTYLTRDAADYLVSKKVRAVGTQDPSRQWNLHNRITQQRPQTVCRREDPDDMHAYQTRRWRWGTGEGGRCTYQLELVRNDEACLRHPGNLKAPHVMEQAVWP